MIHSPPPPYRRTDQGDDPAEEGICLLVMVSSRPCILPAPRGVTEKNNQVCQRPKENKPNNHTISSVDIHRATTRG